MPDPAQSILSPRLAASANVWNEPVFPYNIFFADISGIKA
jgi:hypothetical protein